MHTMNRLLSVAGQELENRRDHRGRVGIVGSIRAIGGKKSPIKIIDISTTGFRIESMTFLLGSQVVFLTMPGFESLEATIMWQTEWVYGCKFGRPLHTTVYEHILRTYPCLGAG